MTQAKIATTDQVFKSPISVSLLVFVCIYISYWLLYAVNFTCKCKHSQMYRTAYQSVWIKKKLDVKMILVEMWARMRKSSGKKLMFYNFFYSLKKKRRKNKNNNKNSFKCYKNHVTLRPEVELLFKKKFTINK